MNSQTTRRPETKRPARPPQAKRYTRQTAHHVATRRDGKPLIFGWGGHLSRKEKENIQRRAIWVTIGLFVVAILVIFAAFWINYNIVIPNEPITSVNGQNIPQADYHKLVALKGQIEDNTIDGKNGLNAQANSLNTQVTAQKNTVTSATNKVNGLKKQIAALHGNSSQRTDLENQLKTATKQQSDAQTQYTTLNTQLQTLQQTTIPNEKQLYVQSQIGNDSAQWLQNDVLIRDWLAKQPGSIQNKIEPTTSQLNNAINSFKNNLPIGTSYAKFLSSDNVSDADVHTMMTLIVRRNNMQSYLASLITSPAKQVRVRDITLSTQGTANNVLKELKSGSDFTKLAKQDSLDTTSKNKGGELGWFVQGQYAQSSGDNISAVIDNWIFASGRQAGELSPVLSENGTFHIIQIEQIDPSRAIDNATLQSLKNNALTVWLLEQQALPGVKIGSVDQNKLLDPSNMPQSIPSSPPTETNPSGAATGGTTTGATGGTTAP